MNVYIIWLSRFCAFALKVFNFYVLCLCSCRSECIGLWLFWQWVSFKEFFLIVQYWYLLTKVAVINYEHNDHDIIYLKLSGIIRWCRLICFWCIQWDVKTRFYFVPWQLNKFCPWLNIFKSWFLNFLEWFLMVIVNLHTKDGFEHLAPIPLMGQPEITQMALVRLQLCLCLCAFVSALIGMMFTKSVSICIIITIIFKHYYRTLLIFMVRMF